MENVLENNSKQPSNARYSGVELLKIFAILLVVVSHVVNSLTNGNGDWVVYIYTGITNFKIFVIALLRYTGPIGNTLFFTCSAWFLLDKNKTNYQKVMRMIIDIFTISMLWFIPVLIWKKGDLDATQILRSFFPTYYSNNWYMTSYILFCFVYPLLNMFIKTMSQKKHLVIALAMFILYFVLSFIDNAGFPFTSFFAWTGNLTFWATIYFIVSYLKLYGSKLCKSIVLNIILLLFALVANTALIYLSNYVSIGTGKMGAVIWQCENNPFILIFSISLFNLMNLLKFRSKVINYISSLSMLIYIIHENILFRELIRPLIWEAIYVNLGYDLLLLWVFLFTICLFVASAGVAILYRLTLERPIHKLSDKLLELIRKNIDAVVN